MKQIILSAAIFLMTVTSNNLSAQSINDVALNINAIIADNSKGKTVEIKVTEVNVRAMRDFTRSYKNITDAKWFKSESGYAVSFSSDGSNTKIVYDSRGN